MFSLAIGEKQHDARCCLAIEGAGLEVDQPGGEAGLEDIDGVDTGEGFVVAEGGEDDVDFFAGQVLFDRGEIVGARLQIDLVGRPGEVADDELVVGMSEVQEGFEMRKLLRAVEQRVADERDAVALFQLQRQGGGDGRGFFRFGSVLRIDAVIGEFGVLFGLLLVELDVFRVPVVLLAVHVGAAAGADIAPVAGLLFRCGDFLRGSCAIVERPLRGILEQVNDGWVFEVVRMAKGCGEDLAAPFIFPGPGHGKGHRFREFVSAELIGDGADALVVAAGSVEQDGRAFCDHRLVEVAVDLKMGGHPGENGMIFLLRVDIDFGAF